MKIFFRPVEKPCAPPKKISKIPLSEAKKIHNLWLSFQLFWDEISCHGREFDEKSPPHAVSAETHGSVVNQRCHPNPTPWKPLHVATGSQLEFQQPTGKVPRAVVLGDANLCFWVLYEHLKSLGPYQISIDFNPSWR